MSYIIGDIGPAGGLIVGTPSSTNTAYYWETTRENLCYTCGPDIYSTCIVNYGASQYNPADFSCKQCLPTRVNNIVDSIYHNTWNNSGNMNGTSYTNCGEGAEAGHYGGKNSNGALPLPIPTLPVTSTAINQGDKNTTNICAANPNLFFDIPGRFIAAEIAKNWSSIINIPLPSGDSYEKKYNDWFLPSRDELTEILFKKDPGTPHARFFASHIGCNANPAANGGSTEQIELPNDCIFWSSSNSKSAQGVSTATTWVVDARTNIAHPSKNCESWSVRPMRKFKEPIVGVARDPGWHWRDGSASVGDTTPKYMPLMTPGLAGSGFQHGLFAALKDHFDVTNYGASSYGEGYIGWKYFNLSVATKDALGNSYTPSSFHNTGKYKISIWSNQKVFLGTWEYCECDQASFAQKTSAPANPHGQPGNPGTFGTSYRFNKTLPDGTVIAGQQEKSFPNLPRQIKLRFKGCETDPNNPNHMRGMPIFTPSPELFEQYPLVDYGTVRTTLPENHPDFHTLHPDPQHRAKIQGYGTHGWNMTAENVYGQPGKGIYSYPMNSSGNPITVSDVNSPYYGYSLGPLLSPGYINTDHAGSVNGNTASLAFIKIEGAATTSAINGADLFGANTNPTSLDIVCDETRGDWWFVNQSVGPDANGIFKMHPSGVNVPPIASQVLYPPNAMVRNEGQIGGNNFNNNDNARSNETWRIASSRHITEPKSIVGAFQVTDPNGFYAQNGAPVDSWQLFQMALPMGPSNMITYTNYHGWYAQKSPADLGMQQNLTFVSGGVAALPPGSIQKVWLQDTSNPLNQSINNIGVQTPQPPFILGDPTGISNTDHPANQGGTVGPWNGNVATFTDVNPNNTQSNANIPNVALDYGMVNHNNSRWWTGWNYFPGCSNMGHVLKEGFLPYTPGQKVQEDPRGDIKILDPVEVKKEIKEFEVNTNNLFEKGEARQITIKGDPGSQFDITIKTDDGTPKYYSFEKEIEKTVKVDTNGTTIKFIEGVEDLVAGQKAEAEHIMTDVTISSISKNSVELSEATRVHTGDTILFKDNSTFTTTVKTLSKQKIPQSGIFTKEIIFPKETAETTYTIELKATGGKTRLNIENNKEKRVTTKTITQKLDTRTIFSLESAGSSAHYNTLPSNITCVSESSSVYGISGSIKKSISWNVTLSANSFNIIRQPLITDFEVTTTQTVNGTISSSTSLVLDSVDGLHTGMLTSLSSTTITAINTATKTLTLSGAASVSDGATVTFTGYGTRGTRSLANTSFRILDFKVELADVTTKVNGATSSSTSVVVDSSDGIKAASTTTVKGIGIDCSTEAPHVDNVVGTTLTLSAAQTLEDDVDLTFTGSSRSATITGEIELISVGETNVTTTLQLDNILNVS